MLDDVKGILSHVRKDAGMSVSEIDDAIDLLRNAYNMLDEAKQGIERVAGSMEASPTLASIHQHYVTVMERIQSVVIQLQEGQALIKVGMDMGDNYLGRLNT